MGECDWGNAFVECRTGISKISGAAPVDQEDYLHSCVKMVVTGGMR